MSGFLYLYISNSPIWTGIYKIILWAGIMLAPRDRLRQGERRQQWHEVGKEGREWVFTHLQFGPWTLRLCNSEDDRNIFFPNADSAGLDMKNVNFAPMKRAAQRGGRVHSEAAVSFQWHWEPASRPPVSKHRKERLEKKQCLDASQWSLPFDTNACVWSCPISAG